MKTFQVSLSKKSLRNIREIGDHIREDAPEAAERICDELLASIRSLAHLPARNVQVGVSRKRGFPIHRLVNHPYNIYYRIETDVVFVLMVRHGMRRPPTRFE